MTALEDAPYAFISYAREDSARVGELCSALREGGIRVWLDRDDLRAGMDWERETLRAIRKATLVLACFSSTSVQKVGFVQREIREAHRRAQEFPDGNVYLVPVMLEPCELPETVRHLQWVELYAPHGEAELVNVVAELLTNASSPFYRNQPNVPNHWTFLNVAVHEHETGAPIPSAIVRLVEVPAPVRAGPPSIIQRVGLEWAYRLAQEPVRMMERSLRGPLSVASSTDANGDARFAITAQSTPEEFRELLVHVESSSFIPKRKPIRAKIQQHPEAHGSAVALALSSEQVGTRKPDHHIEIRLFSKAGNPTRV